MDLLAEITAATTRPYQRCSISVILEAIAPAEAEQLRKAVVDPAFQVTAIARVMTARGFRLRADTVSRHRRGDCSCPKTS